MNLAEPSASKDENDEVFKEPPQPRSRSLSEASSHTITEERVTSHRSRSRSRSRSAEDKSRSVTPASARSRSRSRSRSVSETRSYSSRSRSRTPSRSRSRSRSPSYSRSLSNRSSERKHSHNRSESIADDASIKSVEEISYKSEESEKPLLDLNAEQKTDDKSESHDLIAEDKSEKSNEKSAHVDAEPSYASDFGSESKSIKEEEIASEGSDKSLKRSESSETLKSESLMSLGKYLSGLYQLPMSHT